MPQGSASDDDTWPIFTAGVAIGVAKLKGKPVLRVAIYTRFSSKGQRSTGDQIRACTEWAEANGMTVDIKLIFSDEGFSGRIENRPALNQLRDAAVAREVDVVLCFSTNRLYRKAYKALMFVEETLIANKVRVIFISQGIDSDDEETFDLQMSIATMMDQLALKHGHKHIKASQISKALLNEVCGERTFGYDRKIKAGLLTRRGGPNRINTICPIESKWVKKIFSWFVNDRMTYGEICRRFNTDPKAPKLVRAPRLTVRSLKTILANRRYIGDWSYGWKTNDWKGRKNGPRQVKLPEPQRVIITPSLRIIDDQTFQAAQARLAKMPGAGGRRPRNYDPARPPHPLAGMLHCPKHGRVWINASQFWCKRCYMEHHEYQIRQTLFTGVQPRIALNAICRAIGHALQKQRLTIETVVEAAITHAKTTLAIDRRPLDKLNQAYSRLCDDIQQLMGNLGETEKDREESNAKLKRLRGERAQIDAERLSLQKTVQNPRRLPTADEIHKIVADLQAVLGRAAYADDYEVSRTLRVVLHHLIDGPILLKQEGRAENHRGWLQATFLLRLDRIDPKRVIPGVAPIELVVNLLAPNSVFYAGEEIIRLAEAKMPLKKIAKAVNVPYPVVCRFIAEHFDKPDKAAYVLTRPWLPKSVTGGKSKYELMKDEFKKLADEGWLYQEIADHYGIEIHAIRIGIKAWYEERGLPVPDGRTRRKSLKRKNRRKPPLEPPAAV